MYQMHNNKSPKLDLLEHEFISDGVKVDALDFSKMINKPPFKASFFEVLPGCSTPVDHHRVAECWIVIKGSGLLTYENQVIQIQPQDFLYYSSYEKHQLHNNSDKPIVICSIYW